MNLPTWRHLARAGLVALSCIAVHPAGAAPFVNLDFEQATVVVNDPMFGHLAWDLALPGWQPPVGAPDTATVYLGIPHLGLSPYIELIDDNYYPEWPASHQTSIAGRFSLRMAGSVEPGYGSVWITQTGDVPAWAKALEFVVLGGEPEIYLNDVQIPLVEIDEPGFLRRFAGNVVSFAGTTAELKIQYVEPVVFDEEVPRHSGTLDNIAFTQRLVPEPSSLVLATLALGVVLASSRKPRRGDQALSSP